MRIVAIDTETIRGGEPWSVQMADMGLRNTARMYYCDIPQEMCIVKGILEKNYVLTVLHNAKFDLRVLSQLNIHPAHYECTMQMAYLLGEPSLSLKVLAYRIAGIDMLTYEDVTREATQDKARAYLMEVVSREWDDPEPVIKTANDGTTKLSFPKNIKGKVKRLLAKEANDPSTDLYAVWKAMDITGGRGQVEAIMGIMERAYLNEIDPQDAEEYAKLDSEATLAIYPYLHTQIERYGLQGVLERDMDIVPMVMEMEDNGIKLDIPVLEELRTDLDRLAADTQVDINYLAKGYVNPRSSKQVAALLQDMGIYTDMETSTDAHILDQHREHTIVNKIQDYRAYTKLQSTYVDALIKKAQASSDGKIHTQFSMTRTETGRLASSKPNLQNIPVRTELGRRIRQAFVSERGE